MKKVIDEVIVLLVNDESGVLMAAREILKRQLEKFFSDRKVSIFTANNGSDGIKRLKQLICDLVITDLKMPEKRGDHMITEMIKFYQDNSLLIPKIIFWHDCGGRKGEISVRHDAEFDISDFNGLLAESIQMIIKHKQGMMTKKKNIVAIKGKGALAKVRMNNFASAA